MIHTASLIHDDVLDESDLRRGRPVISLLYTLFSFPDLALDF